ncbi:transglycosylase SLT domain-containing protein [Vibrio rumoiensis]|uniref:transglycosylase SLT domain-containing protein n=1 Tax=Vibrio rumoiensis TaxID=76258 RepID=UPI003AA97518
MNKILLRHLESKRGLFSSYIVILLFIFLFESVAYAKTKKVMPNYFKVMATKYQIPADVLYTLAITESNTKMKDGSYSPWPYTINLDGIGYRYASYEELVKQSKLLMRMGRESFDVGLFQVNWKWNGHRTSSIDELADPYENVRVAAEILKEQYRLYGEWAIAAGRYHNPSNSKGFASEYEKRFRSNLEKVRQEMELN